MENVGRRILADDLPPMDDEHMDRETIGAGKGGLVQKPPTESPGKPLQSK